MEEIDVDELIAEGLEKHRQLKELAAKQVNERIQSDAFNMQYDSVDCFKF